MPEAAVNQSKPVQTKKSANNLKRRIADYRLKRRRQRSARKKNATRRSTIILSLVLLALFGAFAWSLNYLTPHTEGDEVTHDQLTALAEEKRLVTATFLDEDNRLVGSFAAEPIEQDEPKADKATKKGAQDKGADGKGDADAKGDNAGGGTNNTERDQSQRAKQGTGKGAPPADELAAPPGAGDFWVSYPSSDAAFNFLYELVTVAGAEVNVDPQNTKGTVRAVSTYLLPLLILASAFGLLFTAGKGGGSAIGEVMTFGTLDKKKQRKGLTAPTTFGDVGGADEAVAELSEVVDYLQNPRRYEDLGAIPPKGVLLFGPPGCGKTLLAKAVAGEAGVPFFSVAGAEFVESLVGVGAARVRDLFGRVRAVAPAIVFIDELDAAGRKRGGGEGGGSDEREQTLNQLLVEMDGFEASAGVVIIGATNRPDILDPALLRPGRFDRHITVDQPDAEGRELILKLHARGKPMSSSVDFSYLAKRTPGFSGADLANVINEAALLTIRDGKPDIETPELEEAIQRVLHGPKRRGRLLSAEERTRAAYHESGHAVLAAALGAAADVHRITILARAKGLGATGIQREEVMLKTRNQLYSELVTAMGGLAAEEVVFDQPSTGAEQDIEEATDIARDIVGRYGMSPQLGRARLLASDVDQFLGTDSAFAHISEKTHEEFDAELRRLLNEGEQEAMKILEENREVLDDLATTVKEHETVEGKMLAEILARVPSDLERLGRVFADGSSNGHFKDGRTARAGSGSAPKR
ncbi:MAG: ATP-dependent zinc metalloprotease FtsH [Actinomycetota bacterium]